MNDPTRRITLPSGAVVAVSTYATTRMSLRLLYGKPNALALVNRLSELIDDPNAEPSPIDGELQKLRLLNSRGRLHDDVRAIVAASFAAEPEVAL